MPERQTLAYTIMLESYRAQLVLPRDLRKHEADRLCAIIQALIVA